jgi:hypothetical protein
MSIILYPICSNIYRRKCSIMSEEIKIPETTSAKLPKSINWYEWSLRGLYVLLLADRTRILFSKHTTTFDIVLSATYVVIFFFALLGSAKVRNVIGQFYFVSGVLVGLFGLAIQSFSIVILAIIIALIGYLFIWLTKKTAEKKNPTSQPS